MEENKSALTTYESFDHDKFKDEKLIMEEFRKSAKPSNMEELWKSLKSMYLPKVENDGAFFAKYTTDAATGTAIPDTLFAADDDEIENMSEPLVAVKVHTALSLLTQRTPDIKWDSDDDRYEQNTPVINAVRFADWQDDQVRQQYIMLWFYCILYGTTFWRRYYELSTRTVTLPDKIDLATDKETTREALITDFDATTGEAMSPMKVWIDPATQPLKPRSMRKVMWEEVYTYDQFCRKFEDKVSKKVLESIKGTVVEGYQGDDNVCCRYYEHMDLDLYYIEANDEELLKEHLPQNHKQLSIMMAIWMPRGEDSPYGLGPMEMLSEDLHALNKFKSMTLTQVKFSIYKAVFYNGSLSSEGGESGDIKIRPDRAYKYTGNDKIQFLEIPGPGVDSWNAINMLRERIDDASGINRPLGGEIVKTTAFQTDLAKDAALARLSVPIANMSMLLVKDAWLTLELQRQHYALPKVKALVEPEEMIAAQESLDRMKANGETPGFDLWVDTSQVDDNGEMVPRVFQGTYREAQLNLEKSGSGQYVPSKTKNKVLLTSDVFDWKGKIYVVTDSLLTIAPTIEKSRELEMYNLLIPMFTQPPELIAKPAEAICKLYGKDPEDVLPDSFMAYLRQVESGEVQPLQPGAIAPKTGADGAMAFVQPGSPKVSTGLDSEKDLVMAASENAG